MTPNQPFLVTGPYSPLPQLGDVTGVSGPVFNIDQLNQQLAGEPISSSAIPPIIINTTVQNGTIQLNVGSEGFPSLSFYSDPDNGAYYIGANDWALVAAGTKSLEFLSTSITAHKTFNITTLTASRLMASDSSKNLVSVADLASWVAGTSNEIIVTADGDGSITLSTPQAIATGSSPTFAGLHLTSSLQVDGNLGLFGTTPVAQTSVYTLTYNTTTRTFNAYTTDTESSAYTGTDNLQVGNVYATVADLNALRTAYENLRTSYDNVIQVFRQVIGDLVTYGLLH